MIAREIWKKAGAWSTVAAAFLAVSLMLYAQTQWTWQSGGIEVSIAIAGIVASAYAAAVSIAATRARERMRRKNRVFIIYSRKDLTAARTVTDFLADRDFHPWLDVDEIVAGQRWKDAVIEGLADSATALVLISKNLDMESFAAAELKAALATMRSHDESFSPVIPVKIDDSQVPADLVGIQWVDIREPDGFEKLGFALSRILEKKRPSKLF